LRGEVSTEPAEVEEPLLQSRWCPVPPSQTHLLFLMKMQHWLKQFFPGSCSMNPARKANDSGILNPLPLSLLFIKLTPLTCTKHSKWVRDSISYNP
jgi:hypothetical protein